MPLLLTICRNYAKELIARSGFEALAHAVESYVSTMATDLLVAGRWKLLLILLRKSYNGIKMLEVECIMPL